MIVTYRETIIKAMKEPRTVREIAEITGLDRQRVQVNVLDMLKRQKYTINRIEEDGQIRYQFIRYNKLKRTHIRLKGSRYPRQGDVIA